MNVPNLHQLAADIIEWQDETFPGGEPEGCFNHLYEEVTEELASNPYDIEEQADCFFLIIALATRCGYSLDDFCAAIADKLTKNKSRTWGPPDQYGVIHHVDDAARVESKKERVMCFRMTFDLFNRWGWRNLWWCVRYRRAGYRIPWRYVVLDTLRHARVESD